MRILCSREELVEEAMTWQGTPYVRNGRIKGVGCDCGTFPSELYTSMQVLSVAEIGHFSSDWFKHTTNNRYLYEAMKHATLMAETRCFASMQGAQPGGLLLAKVVGSRVYNHSGVVVAWPHILHAIFSGVCLVDASRDPMWAGKQIAIIDPWEGANAG